MNSHRISRQSLSAAMSRHKLVLFFAITFLFSWTIYGTLALVAVANTTAQSRILLIGAFGPSISAMLLSTGVRMETNTAARAKRTALWILIVACVAGIEWLDHVWWRHSVDATVIWAEIALVALSAFVALRFSTNLLVPGVDWQGTPSRLRNLPWYLAALGLWPLLVWTGSLTAHALGLTLTPGGTSSAVQVLPLAVESFFWYLFFGGPLNEEPGWRGFALPRLCLRFSPLIASIILGAFWGYGTYRFI